MLDCYRQLARNGTVYYAGFYLLTNGRLCHGLLSQQPHMLARNDKPNVSIATLMDSSYLPRQSRTVRITGMGMEDAG